MGLEENINFYKNKRVMITGHTGFKGAWLSCILNYLGANIVGYALGAEKGSLFSKLCDKNIIKSNIGDIRDYNNLRKVMSDFKPDMVIHMAAFAYLNECYADPRRTYETNVIGTLNVLEAVKEEACVKSLVIVSTDKVYKNDGTPYLFLESDNLGGDTPYACSKTCAELVVNDYRETYFKDRLQLGIGTVRASNVLGGGDHISSRLIPSILRAVSKDEPVEIRNPNQTRPWQSILDALDGYLTLGRKLNESPIEYSGAWNIGPRPDGIKSVGWIYEKIRAHFQDITITTADKISVSEASNLGLDISKAISRLEWEPRQSLEDIIVNLVSFYKGQINGEKEYDLCMKQIEDYYERRE